MYDITGYYKASDVEEAIALSLEHPQARFICGGSDVLIKIRNGKMAGTEVISIREIPELLKIEKRENGDILIGAACTFSHITANPIIQECIPVLGEAVDLVGGPQVRNIGTIGGNICNGAVSADSAPTVHSLEALIEVAEVGGRRLVPVEDFYLGPGRVDLKPGQLVTNIVIPRDHYEGYKGHYMKYSMRNAMDIATLSCSVVSKVRDDILEDVRITFGVAAPVPYRCRQTEEALRGKKIDESLYDLAEASVRQEINPRDSWRASRTFRLQIAGEIARRALKKTVELSGGDHHE